jgi:hypothetical protein
VLVYKTDDGRVKLEVRLENETVWLTQQLMAELFQTTKQNIGQHLKNIFDEGELAQDSVVKKFFTTAADGKHKATGASRQEIAFQNQGRQEEWLNANPTLPSWGEPIEYAAVN